MLRKFAFALLALVMVFGVVIAAEVKGKLKELTNEKIVVTVEDKDETYVVNDDTKIVDGKGNPVKDRAKAITRAKAGTAVVIQTDKKDGKDVATEIKIAGGKKKTDKEHDD